MDTNGHTILCEDYVSFETAVLLKEKGFDEVTNFHYKEGCKLLYGEGDIWLSNSDMEANEYNGFSAPTHQMALKWLREVHKIIVEINMEDYITEVDGKLTITYSYTIWHFNRHLNDIGETDIRYTDEAIWDKDSHNSYEEAVEAALLYVLKNLI